MTNETIQPRPPRRAEVGPSMAERMATAAEDHISKAAIPYLPPAAKAETITKERKNAHGDWLVQSSLGNRLKGLMRDGSNWPDLRPHQQEALDMIATKISRILSGDPAHEDHWDDIMGYALLGKGGHK